MTPQKKLIDGEALPKVNIDIQEKTLAALPWPLNLPYYNNRTSHHIDKSFGTFTINLDYSDFALRFTRSEPRADGKYDLHSFTHEFPSIITEVHFENDVIVVQTEGGGITKLNLKGE